MLGLEQVFLLRMSVLCGELDTHKSLQFKLLRANVVSRVKNVFASAFTPSFATALA